MSKVLSKKILSLAMIFAALAGSALLIMSNNSFTSAATESIANEVSLSEKGRLLKTEIVGVKTASVNPDIELRAELDELELSLQALNRGSKSANLDVDIWESRLSGPAWYIAPEKVTDKVPDIAQANIATIKRVDLSKFVKGFELFPGTYTAELAGFKWREIDFGNFTEQTYVKDYQILANITIGYDEDLITSSPPENRLLKTVGMALEIQGTGNRYEITAESPKQVSFYIVNDGDTKISGEVGFGQFNIWHNNHRFPDRGTTTIRETPENQCILLNPGERKLVDTFEFSEEAWPIGGNGIAEDLGSVSPGIYVAHYSVTTSDCMTPEGENIPGSSHIIIAAFEVMQ